MSKQSKLRAKQLRAAKASKSASPHVGNKKPQEKNPVIDNAQKETKDGKFNIPVPQLIGVAIVWLAGSVGLAIVVNHFSVSPNALYISAITLCLLLIWVSRQMRSIRWVAVPLYFLFIFGTHKYIQSELRKNAITPVTETVGLVRGLVFHEKIEHVTVSLGGINMGFDPSDLSKDATKRKAHGPQFNDSEPIVPYVENGRLFCDLEFVAILGIPPIKLEHNVLSGKPTGWDWTKTTGQ